MGFLVALVVLLLDQGTKFLVQAKLEEGISIPVIQKFFYLTYIKNPGAAFGMLAHRTQFFVVISLVVIGIIVYYYRKIPKEWVLLKVGLAMQAGGAAGNMLDRIRFGKVVDFLDFHIWSYIFNVADAAITVGAAILAVYLVRGAKQDKLATSGEGQQSEGQQSEG